MDTRVLVIALPLLVAASWALLNIGRLAIQQSYSTTSTNEIKNFQTLIF